MSLEGHEQDDCLCQKQLFGRIEVVKAKNNFLVTAHFGKFYDAGCISVRKINSPIDLPVIFSIYEVIYIWQKKNGKNIVIDKNLGFWIGEIMPWTIGKYWLLEDFDRKNY